MARNGCIVALAVIGLGGAALYQHHRAAAEKEARERAELMAGVRASEVLDSTFGQEASLRVATLTGHVKSQGSCASGGLFTDTQQTIAPYSAAYSIDLGQVRSGNFRWDARDRVMFVDVPGVVVEPPAIDLARARTAQTGLFISRACGLAMQSQVAGRLQAAVADKALAPDYIARARESARVAIERLVRQPLAAAGLPGVTVRVHFATDPRPADDRQWDVSRSIRDVLADPLLRGSQPAADAPR